MATEEQDLVAMALDGAMDYSRWPDLLERVIPRLEHIAYNDFPIPSIPLPGPVPPGVTREQSPISRRESIDRDEPPEKKVKREADSMDVLQDARKKEADLPAQMIDSSASETAFLDPPTGTLPPLLLTLLQTIISTLRTSFSTSPPYTSQRLAELLLYPRKHYRTLPSYLRALDRIVSVASPASIFPLKNLSATSTPTNGAMLNGTSSPLPDPADDADFIGGAQLTEIPWAPKQVIADAAAEGMHSTTNSAPTNASDLRTESTSLIEGPNGLGGVETVTVASGATTSTTGSREDSTVPSTPTVSSATVTGTSTPQHGITQGEILRQEQEAGIVPVPSPTHSSQGGNSSRITRSSAAASAAASRAVGITGPDVAKDSSSGEAPVLDEEIVHARGPGVIGMEDMGPQAPGSGLEGGIEVEGALGRSGDIVTQSMDSRDSSSQGTGATQELDGMNLKADIVMEEKQESDELDAEVIAKKEKEEMEKLEDNDAMITDADGVREGDEGRNVGQESDPDIVDSTTL